MGVVQHLFLLLAFTAAYLEFVSPLLRPSGGGHGMAHGGIEPPPGGAWASLSYGDTFYRLEGPEEGELVVFFHGFAANTNVFDDAAEALVNAGKRVLRFDFYGRGFSAAPNAIYDEHLFSSQASELLFELGLGQESFDLVGLSMGGAIAARFTEVHSERVKRLFLIAPAGFPVDVPFFGHLVRMSVFGDLLYPLVARTGMAQFIRRDFPDGDLSESDHMLYTRFLQLIDLQIENNPNFKTALLSTLRDFDLGGMSESIYNMGKTKRPTKIFWGEEDRTVPFANAALYKDAIPNAEIVSVPGRGHFAMRQEKKLFLKHLVEFLD